MSSGLHQENIHENNYFMEKKRKNQTKLETMSCITQICTTKAENFFLPENAKQPKWEHSEGVNWNLEENADILSLLGLSPGKSDA